MSSPVRFYFDFISPYSYLASALIEREPRYAALPFELRPVVFGSVLAKLGAKGQGEIPARRRLGMADVLLLAKHYGVPLEGPPTHPFNSVYALRSVSAVADPVARRALMHRYFLATWGEGRSLEDLAVLRDCLRDVGIEQDPEAAATTREAREALRANLASLLELGGWGVPTFVVDDVLLWGHDRLPLLAELCAGKLALDRPKLEELLARPQPGRIT